jgi:hypothetical protein
LAAGTLLIEIREGNRQPADCLRRMVENCFSGSLCNLLAISEEFDVFRCEVQRIGQ